MENFVIEYRNPRYCANGWIDCEINHPQYGWVPFTCNPDDEGASFDVKELFERMVNDGKVKAYAAPVITEEQKAIDIRFLRDEKLKAVDALVSNPLRWGALSAEQQSVFANYRQALLDVPQQTGFPSNVVWPQQPQ